MTTPRWVSEASTSRNLFEDFDDGQSDISVDTDDRNADVDFDVDQEEVTDLDLEVGDGGDDGPQPGPVPVVNDDGWTMDCQQAGASVLPFTKQSGPTNVLDLDAEPIDYFFQLIPEEFFHRLAEQTNLYATQRVRRTPRRQATPAADTPTPDTPTPDATTTNFKPTTPEEIKSFLAIHIFMGICDLPNYKMYWSSDPTFNQQFVSNLMTRNRYEELTTNFHMIDSNENPPRGQEGHDPIHKVRPIISLVQETWPANFGPGRDVCVDEAMIAFKGRCAFRQYIPAKPTKWGLKVWALCDSKSYYMVNMSLYTGKYNDFEHNEGALGERVVKKLMNDYLASHHIVYMDNYFTSIPLLQYLHDNETYACGTIRTNRKGLPQQIKDPKVVKKSGDTVRMYKDNVQAIAWFDRKKVTVVSTAHTNEDGVVSRRTGPGTTQEYSRPIAIEAYSANFSGVDKNDQLRSYYSLSIKAYKWWKYVFYFCMDVSLTNAYINYQNAPGGPRPKKLSHLDFIISIMKALGTHSTRKRMGRPKRIATHELERITTGRGQRDCAQCKKQGNLTKSGKRKQSTYQCLACNVGLCKACFEAYHRQ